MPVYNQDRLDRQIFRASVTTTPSTTATHDDHDVHDEHDRHDDDEGRTRPRRSGTTTTQRPPPHTTTTTKPPTTTTTKPPTTTTTAPPIASAHLRAILWSLPGATPTFADHPQQRRCRRRYTNAGPRSTPGRAEPDHCHDAPTVVGTLALGTSTTPIDLAALTSSGSVELFSTRISRSNAGRSSCGTTPTSRAWRRAHHHSAVPSPSR